jgi:hypothetical protein
MWALVTFIVYIFFRKIAVVGAGEDAVARPTEYARSPASGFLFLWRMIRYTPVEKFMDLKSI